MVGASDDATLSDEDLLARIGKADRSAFTMLMRRHGRQVRGLALAFSGRAADADDVTQDVFIMLWRRPQAWRPGKAAFSTWLYRVVANRCLDLARRQRVRGWLSFSEVADPGDDAPSALDVLAGRSRLEEVRRMIRTLPEKQRLALLLAVQGEKSNADRLDFVSERGSRRAAPGARQETIARVDLEDGGRGMTREEFGEALLRRGADLERWPEALARSARLLAANDPLAAKMLMDHAAFDQTLAEAVEPPPFGAAEIGSVLAALDAAEAPWLPARRFWIAGAGASALSFVAGFILMLAVIQAQGGPIPDAMIGLAVGQADLGDLL